MAGEGEDSHGDGEHHTYDGGQAGGSNMAIQEARRGDRAGGQQDRSAGGKGDIF
jgi:hypothetical protein